MIKFQMILKFVKYLLSYIFFGKILLFPSFTLCKVNYTNLDVRSLIHFQKPQVKKPTKAEQIRRHFTPSPEHLAASSSTDDEDLPRGREKRLERQEHNHGRQRQERR